MRWQNVLAAIALLSGTLAFDSGLADISNLPRLFFWALFLTGVMFLTFRQSQPSADSRMKVTYAFLLCFVVWQFISVAWAVNRAEALYAASRWLLAATTMAATFSLMSHHPVRGIVLLARCSAIVAVLSLIPAVRQILSLPDCSWSNRYAVVSLFTHKGTFAMLLALLSVFPAIRLCLRLRRGRWCYIVLLVVLGLMEAFLLARAVLLALAAGCGCWLAVGLLRKVFRKRNLAPQGMHFFLIATVGMALLSACVAVGGAAMMSKGPVEADGDGDGIRSTVSLCERRALWRLTLRMAEERPVAGCGAGNWKVCHPNMSVGEVFSIDVLDFHFVRPHNEYLSILSETGGIGLLLFLLSIMGMATNAFVTICKGGRRQSLIMPGLAALAAVAVFAFFDFPFERTELLLWTSVVTGGVYSLCRNGKTSSCPLKSRHYNRAFLALPIAIALLSGVRWHSERHMGEVMNGIHTMRWPLVEQCAHEAQNPFATLAPDGVPYAYYEAMAREYQHKSALPTFRKALHDSPYDKQVINDVARLLYTERHETDSATALLRQAVRISPHYSRSYFNLAQVYLSENRPQEAIEVLRSFDLETKRIRLEKNVWHYLSVHDAEYYFKSLLPAEEQMRDRLLQAAESCQ